MFVLFRFHPQMYKESAEESIKDSNTSLGRSMKAVADLEAANLSVEQALKQANERASKNHGELAAANDDLTAQLAQSTAANTELEASNGQLKEQLATSVSEYQEFKDINDKRMAELSAQLDKDRERVRTLQLQGSKDTEEIAAVRSS